MQPDDLRQLVGYNIWATERLLPRVAQLNAEQFHAPGQTTHGSIFELVRHMLDVEWSWRLVAQEQRGSNLLWEEIPLPDLATIQQVWAEEHKTLYDFVTHADEATLNQTLDFGTIMGGKSHHAKTWHLIIHLIDHATNHRSELCRVLTEFGDSPGDIDFLDYVSTVDASNGK